MSNRKKGRDNIWQSFADLAMGLVGVLLLVVVILVAHEQNQRIAQADDARALQDFAQGLLLVIEGAQEVQSRQGRAASIVNQIFREGECRLGVNTDTGALEFLDRPGAALYETGETRVNEDASRALQDCHAAFLHLAACIAPENSPLRQACHVDEADADFGEEIDAIVVAGSTDRLRYDDAPRIQGPRSRRDLHPLTGTFTDNSFLGAERARQALGHLLWRAQADDERADANTNSALQVLMARVRIESSSFAQYQVGPAAWRNDAAADCGEDGECPAARSLTLRLRWKERSVRRPFRNVVRRFCDEWGPSDGAIRGILGRDPQQAERAQRVCDQYDRDAAE